MKQQPRQGPRLVRDLDREIGLALNHQRKRSGLTLHQLADKLGVSYQQAHKYENGTNRITAARLFECAVIMGVSVLDFYPDEVLDETPPVDQIKGHLQAISDLVEGSVS